jgi:hypothetical protein
VACDGSHAFAGARWRALRSSFLGHHSAQIDGPETPLDGKAASDRYGIEKSGRRIERTKHVDKHHERKQELLARIWIYRPAFALRAQNRDLRENGAPWPRQERVQNRIRRDIIAQKGWVGPPMQAAFHGCSRGMPGKPRPGLNRPSPWKNPR